MSVLGIILKSQRFSFPEPLLNNSCCSPLVFLCLYIKNEFIIHTGGVAESSMFQYWHTGYPTVAQCLDSTVVVAYHQYSNEKEPIQEMWVSSIKL